MTDDDLPAIDDDSAPINDNPAPTSAKSSSDPADPPPRPKAPYVLKDFERELRALVEGGEVPRAVELLFERYGSRLEEKAHRRLREEAAARNAYVDTFFTLRSELGRFSWSYPVEALLFLTLRRVASAMRRRHVSETSLGDKYLPALARSGPATRERRLGNCAFRRLTPDEQALVRARAVEELDWETIARMLRMKANTARKRYSVIANERLPEILRNLPAVCHAGRCACSES